MHGLTSGNSAIIGGVHIGARALLDIILIWFGYTARLSQGGRGGYLTCSNDFYLQSRRLEGGRRVSTLWSVRVDLLSCSASSGVWKKETR
jgi:hypothetical protein